MRILLPMLSMLFSFSLLACDGEELCVGDRVMYTSGDLAVVQEVFRNGKVVINWDNSSWADSVVDISQVSKDTRCLGHICNRDRVVYTSGDRAVVKESFRNGKVVIDWDNSSWANSVVKVSEISKVVSCTSGNLCVGHRVAYKSGDTARVKEVYEDDRVLIDWDHSSWADSVVKAREVARAFRCMGDLCAGDRVIYKSNDRANVVEVFEDGRVRIDWDNSSWADSVVSITDLGFSAGDCRD